MAIVGDKHITVYRGLGDGGLGFGAEPTSSLRSAGSVILQMFNRGSPRSTHLAAADNVDRQSLLIDNDDHGDDDEDLRVDSDDECTRC